DLPRLWGRVSRIARPRLSGGANPIPARVRVISPQVAPPTSSALRRLNSAALLPRLADYLRRVGLREGALAMVYVPTATTLELLELLKPGLVVYDCASNFRAHPKAPADFPSLERRLLERSGLVVCDSDFLYQQKKNEHSHVAQIHQGVPSSFFAARPPDPAFRRFCYYGTWGKELDGALLGALARSGLEVTFSGFIKTAGRALPAQARRLPPVRREALVERLQGFDAFALPYRITPFMLGVIPAKLYEMLAMGRPVIATPLPSLKPLEDLIYIGETPQDWARLALELPRRETDALRRRRVELAREHTHEREFARLQEAIESASRRQRPRPTAGPARNAIFGPFLRGLSTLTLFYGLARAATLLTQVAAGRWLGVVEFGKAGLAIAAAAFLQIPPMLGFPLTLTKFLPEHESERERRALISTTLTAFLIWASATAVPALLWRYKLAAMSGLPPGVFLFALAYAYATALYTVLASPLLGLRRFKERGSAETIYGFSALALLALLAALGLRDYRTLLGALCAALLGASGYAAWRLRSLLRPGFDRKAFRTVRGYAIVASLNLLTAAFVLAPARLILNACDGLRAVGIFGAYFTATAQLALALLTIAASVIVPFSSTPEGHRRALAAFRRWALPLSAAAACGFLAAAVLGLKLFGRQYPMRPQWLALFAAAATLLLLHGVVSALLSARDFSGLSVSATGGLIAGVGNAVLCLWMIPRWGIGGAAGALIVGYALGLAFYAAAETEMVYSPRRFHE
ncbi:MAG: oligosaccharide flippase family protein, partial [Elusimicrobia bacterium]|nr:oligosaccharide flippase family protein [Elusimicrobiota bacterium]